MCARNTLVGLCLLMMGATDLGGQTRGERPYEMVWAGRVQDTEPPLIDFEQLAGWTVSCEQAVASWTLSQEQQLWGDHVAKLVYRGTGPDPKVALQPPSPVICETPFDCINLWVYGNNWAWAPDPGTPQVEIRLVFQNAAGTALVVPLDRVRWKEWWLLHRRLTPEQLDTLGDRPRLASIEVVGGRNADDRVLYFDNLALYVEALPPLTFEPRPARGIQLPAGQTTGTNTGPGTLPFPTRDETILPDNGPSRFRTAVEPGAEDTYEFRYQGDDGELVYRYRPRTGTLSDLTAQWVGRCEPFHPCVDGGVYFATGAGEGVVAPDRIERLEVACEADRVSTTWRCVLGPRTADVTYTLRLWQKSLVIDVHCSGHELGEFRIGRAVGVADPRLVTLPYLAGAGQRPAVLVAGAADLPLFMSAILDHCRTNASLFWFSNRVADDGVTQNGGSRYLPKTDGARNPVFERLFLTVSPRFEQTLPNIPNPKSPWMHVTGQCVWRAHGASDRASDYAFWKKVARYGMTKVAITDHETGWRDGGESFTLRTRAAPKKGGDAGQADYARRIRALGFRYGIYNNYTDFAPVNEFWDADYVTRLPDNQWQPAWARCYNLKPARAVELEARLAPIIQDKFQLDTAYCDVHTAVTPWAYCDFDARVPGAGTMAVTFYAYGEIMLHQKRTWNGPVYSEGNNHWYYCGLTDGNYGQDQVARLADNPWLVDFDLLKIHPLCCNFGMGNPNMFYGDSHSRAAIERDRDGWLDRFLAATLAFGHTGFLVFEGGFDNAVRSYYSVQQVHARYAQQAAASIRYHDGQGNLLDTSAAVATGAYRRSQVVTRYADGLTVWVNGHTADPWPLPARTLPPNGWYVQSEEGDELLAFSALVDGRRADYVDGPAYLYANGRGALTRFPKATARGQLVALHRDGDTMELFGLGEDPVLGIALHGRAATAVALDADGKPMGEARTVLSRGIVYVTPISGAVSYLLTPTSAPQAPLTCQRTTVVPGETVVVEPGGVTVRIPPDAPIGSQFWHEVDGQWIDFTVVPLVDASLALTDGRYALELKSNLPRAATAAVQLGDQACDTPLPANDAGQLTFAAPARDAEQVDEVPLTVAVDGLEYRRTWWLQTRLGLASLGTLSESLQSGERLRGNPETTIEGRTLATVHWTDRACGQVSKKCLFMHPPYQGGVGYAFALFEPVQLPATPGAAFRCNIGKGDGSEPGDGILFRVAVVDQAGTETVVAERQWIEHAWTGLEADLSRWSGQQIRIKLIADVGPRDNSVGDWACWADLRIESRADVPITTLHDQPPEMK